MFGEFGNAQALYFGGDMEAAIALSVRSPAGSMASAGHRDHLVDGGRVHRYCRASQLEGGSSMSERAAPILPGRLGNPDMTLADDPRADPRMIAALAPLGIGGPVEPFPLTVDHPLEDLHAYADEGEQGFGAVGDVLLQGLDPVTGVTRSVEVIPGVDGNDITLYISRPEAADGALPGILHIHGGGMVFLEAAAGNYQRWRDELAVTGLVVVGVEFRNASGKHGPVPVPGRLERLLVGAAVDARPPRRPGHRQDRRVR